jgi:hypothetical protein
MRELQLVRSTDDKRRLDLAGTIEGRRIAHGDHNRIASSRQAADAVGPAP